LQCVCFFGKNLSFFEKNFLSFSKSFLFSKVFGFLIVNLVIYLIVFFELFSLKKAKVKKIIKQTKISKKD
jgi:hypothetical protein